MRERLAWICLAVFLTIPLVTEDLTGLVYNDQSFFSILLDHLFSVGMFIGCKGLWHLREAFYNQLSVEEVKVLIDHTYES